MGQVVGQQDIARDAAVDETETETLAAFDSGDMQGQPKPIRIFWFFGDR
jgi:hypothetical protein